MAPVGPLDIERDACGVGFVADASGRASHGVVTTALEALRRVRHRGAVAADRRSGDGAGMLAAIPRGLFGELGVGMCFLPPSDEARARRIVEQGLRAEGVVADHWREVPVAPEALGEHARATMPRIWQVLIQPPAAGDPEVAAFRARRRIERAARTMDVRPYVASLSFATVTYKALCAADQLAAFFPDLRDERFDAWFAVYHQRFSTNTAPTWERAQPFRFLCHNGEINTIQGNANRMRAREGRLGAGSAADEELLVPVVDPDGSDSAMLDNAVELLVRGGRSVSHALAMLVPPAWEEDPELDPTVRDFYHYLGCLAEPWDGPAALVFTDGRIVGARLDRNGLRPLRYVSCQDGLVSCGSEAGVVDVDGHGAVRRGRLGPGETLVIDPAGGGLLEDFEVTWDLAASRPYGVWLSMHLRHGEAGRPTVDVPEDLVRRQVAFGFTSEEITAVLRPMAEGGTEAVSSMGDDTAEPSLANRPRSVFGFLKQRFAQVTNPPIDPIHERTVTSLRTHLGPRAPLLSERPNAASLVELPTFFLFPEGLHRLRHGPFIVADLDATFAVADGEGGLRTACARLAAAAERAVRAGASLLTISDDGVGPARAAVPSLLALGAVHQRLVASGRRGSTSIVVDGGDVREVHHAACLLGYGADAIVPRVALQTIAHIAHEGRLGGAARGEALSPIAAQDRLRAAFEEGVRKVMSKMGIATVDAYRSAQIFEAIGLADEVVDLCLAGTPSPLGGLGFEALARGILTTHAAAFGRGEPALAHPGFLKHRAGGEYHATNPDVVAALQETLGVGATGPTGAQGYARFAAMVDERPAAEPRDLLEPAPAASRVPLDQVEPAGAILSRFSAGAMSHGALSAEAHETIAEAMNLLVARSNCGEGGEDPSSYGTVRNSRIKQVASGRFGVTASYCVSADELQIKMAQGSKPGEGGQLPGHKVTAEIARLRHTTPGVPLISPPPHHDIYSIEDLAQLIFDLKQVNPLANVSVKLVSTIGVGVIAAGVVKAGADVVHIAGADGGTGASPLSSIKNAGLPWEVGLTEARRELLASGLRDRVRLRVDGGFKTGRDVVIAALLGADEFSFGTALLLSEGCIMVRACHRDTCPTGIATQREDLRQKFAGTPDRVATYLRFVAEDIRDHLATLGLRTLDQATGRTDLLRAKTADDERLPALDVTRLLDSDTIRSRDSMGTEERQGNGGEGGRARRGEDPSAEGGAPAPSPYRHPPHAVPPLSDRLTTDAFPAIRDGALVDLRYDITNSDRTFGARLGGQVARTFGSARPPGIARIALRGSAGQSFGAFLTPGVELSLEGEANDYVGKGMSGGLIAIRAPEDDAYDPVLIGNTVLYGATGGELYVAGRAGERFAVRNSGAVAVVEGTGAHACEYMTGGVTVILGPVGRNLGAGMSGGECFVFDPDGTIDRSLNPGMVVARRIQVGHRDRLEALIRRHARLTGSRVAAAILGGWPRAAEGFWRVAPEAIETDAATGPGRDVAKVVPARVASRTN